MTSTAILRDVPEQFETDRLVVRCPRPGDGRRVHEAVVETLDHLRAWPASLPWAMAEPTEDASETYCRQSQVEYLARRGFAMLLLRRSDGALVGSSGLHHIDWDVPAGEVGYWCRRREQGQGYIAEAVLGITAFAARHLGLRRIVSKPDALNGPSCRVAERAGYALEGVMRHERRAPDGTMRDTCLYAWTDRAPSDRESLS